MENELKGLKKTHSPLTNINHNDCRPALSEKGINWIFNLFKKLKSTYGHFSFILLDCNHEGNEKYYNTNNFKFLLISESKFYNFSFLSISRSA